MTVRWIDSGTVGQPIFPIQILPAGWPAGVPMPAKPAWWPDGLMYPPVGTSWAPQAPVWWSTSPSLPNWPPPQPVGWPNFPWPIPPAAATQMLPCDALCEAQFGTKGTTPAPHALHACKETCKLAGGATRTSTIPGVIPSSQLRPTSPETATTTEKKESNTGFIVVGVLAVAAIAAYVVFGD